MMLPTILLLLCQTNEPPKLGVRHDVVAAVGATVPSRTETIAAIEHGFQPHLEGFLSEDGLNLFLKRFSGSSGIWRYNLMDRSLVKAEPLLYQYKTNYVLGMFVRPYPPESSEFLWKGESFVEAHASFTGLDVLVTCMEWGGRSTSAYRWYHTWYAGIGPVSLARGGWYPMIAGGTGLMQAVEPILDVQDVSLSLVVAGVGTLAVTDESREFYGTMEEDRVHMPPYPEWPRAKMAPRLHEDFLGTARRRSAWGKTARRILWNSRTAKVVGVVGEVPRSYFVALGRADGSKPLWLKPPAPEGRQADIECLAFTKDDRVFVGIREFDPNVPVQVAGLGGTHRVYEIKGKKWLKIADARLRATNTRGDRWLVEREDGSGGWLVRLL